jgi:hypothetical protein
MHVGLRCTYASIPTSRSRKRALARGSVIAEWRTLSCQSSQECQPEGTLSSRVVSVSIPTSIVSHPQFELLPRVLTRIQTICVPMSPVIPASEGQDMISKMDDSRDAASFVYIFAAVTLNLTRGEPVQEAPATRERIATLLTVTATITASRGCVASDG